MKEVPGTLLRQGFGGRGRLWEKHNGEQIRERAFHCGIVQLVEVAYE